MDSPPEDGCVLWRRTIDPGFMLRIVGSLGKNEKMFGAPRWTRTIDPGFIRAVLSPTELWAQTTAMKQYQIIALLSIGAIDISICFF